MAASDPLARVARLDGVASAMAAARDGIDALLRDRGLRRTTPDLTARSLLLGARASAAIEGADVDVADVAVADVGVAELREDDGGPQVRAAVRVSTELLSLVPVLGRAPSQALARLHVFAASGAGPGAAAAAGRPRDAERASRLRDLATTLSSPTQAPAMVVAAVVHAELATAAPFGSFDALVARAAERLVLVARGVDPASLVVPEAAHLSLRPEYESNLRGYAVGGAAGLHAWLLYAAQAYARAAEASPLNDEPRS